MGFYDNWNFDGLKFLSQIKDRLDDGISEPCEEFLDAVKHLKSITPPHSITVAEIGIGFGATALQILQMLDKDDVYYCFDFGPTLLSFVSDLQARDFGIKCQITMAGNSFYDWDSYNWNLSNMIFRMREQNLNGIFDAVYLDGAHTLFHDGLAVCLLKELIKDGGILILDDLFWKVSENEWCRQHWKMRRLTMEQMEDMQVLRVQELFLSNDPNFEKLSSPNSWRGVFRKRSR